jgi:hypothetical protein
MQAGEGMSMMISRRSVGKLILWIILLSFAVLACNLELNQFGIGQKEATETDSSPTSALMITPGGGSSSGTSGAACLPGRWQVDHESVIDYMSDTMEGVGEEGFTPLASEGKLSLVIETREVYLAAVAYQVDVGVNIGGKVNANSNKVTIQADASAGYLASDTQINLTEITYDVGGTLESDTGLFTLDMDDLLVIANTYGFARDLTLPIQSTYFSYTCSGDVLTIQVNPYAAVAFNREN